MYVAKGLIRKLALSYALSVLLPTLEQTLLLRACLWLGERGRNAWKAWCERVGDPVELLRDGNVGLKGLMPLIFAALRGNGVMVEDMLRTCLHTATLREGLRINAYRRILNRVLSSYVEKRIPAIVVKGAALAETVYESPSLRHSGGIEILIEDIEPSCAVNPLLSLGFSQIREGVNPAWNEIKLKHDSGLPLHLQRGLFRIPYYNMPFDDLWIRSQIQPIAGVPVRILSPADNLLHICSDAFFSRSRESLLWVFDTWFLINKYSNIDWEGLLVMARRSHLELPLSVTMGYLVEKLGAPIPLSFVERLYAAASEAGAEGRVHALSIAREGVRGNYMKMIWTNGNWCARAYMIWWLLCLSPKYLRSTKPIRRIGLLLSRYLSMWPHDLTLEIQRLLNKFRNSQFKEKE
jgi:hypothetical protein